MQVNNDISFGAYHSVLKTLWKQGQLPTVRKGFYGDTLTLSNISLDHISPYSGSRRTELSNLVLTSAKANRARGSKPLWKIINMGNATGYLDQFIGVHIPGKFDGNQYIRMITRKLKNIGIDLEKGIITKTCKRKNPKTRRTCFKFNFR